jgi:rhodanese-related sulfurtransferase
MKALSTKERILMANVEDTIDNIKGKIPNVTPTPPGFHSVANAHELKSRLSFGEPALTIFDIRDRDAFQSCRIMGAMQLSMEGLQGGERPSVADNRDIYVYGDSDENTATAAEMVRSMGFSHVAELKGGLEAWRSIGGATEGTATEHDHAGADEYNVVSRLKEFSEERSREESMKRQ